MALVEVEESFSEGNVFDHYYGNVSDRSEPSKRTDRINILQGQAAFFNLLTRLDVPVLDRSSNVSGGQDHLLVGAGASFGVTRAMYALPSSHTQTINLIVGSTKLEDGLKRRHFVTKRIAPNSSPTWTDAQRLAAITNEVRILAKDKLKHNRHLVRLLCVAWDEVPTQGRCWPRLLLETTDYGNLGEFLARSPDASDWNIKFELLAGVTSGLQALHEHGVAHCDLKLENVLVFREDETNRNPMRVQYRTKLCDFGFSIILTDYEQDAKISERIGTEPWTSPELTFGTEIRVDNLSKSDIYSLGLLIARVLMNGGNPFEGLSVEQTRELKCDDEDGPLALCRCITRSIVSSVDLTERQRIVVGLLISNTLLYKPERRFQLRNVGVVLEILGKSFGAPSAGEDAQTECINNPKATASIPNRVTSGIAMGVEICLSPMRFLRQRAMSAKGWVPRKASKLPVIRDPMQETARHTDGVCIKPIPRLTPTMILEPDPEGSDIIHDIPNFEDITKFTPRALSPSVAKELIHDLLAIVDISTTSGKREGEAAYQLAIASHEGIAFPRNLEKCLQWLEIAVIKGSKKAMSALPNIVASMNRAMSRDVRDLIRSSLATIAKNELITSSSNMLLGIISEFDEFSALRSWHKEDPQAREEFLASDELRMARSNFLSAALLTTYGRPLDCIPFDFQVLDGYDPTLPEYFSKANTSAFVRSVQEHDCLKRSGVQCMTLLQLAAARGDLELAKALVLGLGADVDDCGITPGLTPLWISCFSGNIEVAIFLTEHGADASCRDAETGRTVLHFLNQCRCEQDIIRLLGIGLSGNLTLEEKANGGMTPLLSTFIGWDYSNGLAARILITLNVNTLVQSSTDWNPLVGAIVTLDVHLAQEIIDSYKNFQCQPLDLTVEEAKAKAFGALGTMGEFHRRRVSGANWLSDLRDFVELLLDSDAVAALKRSGFSLGANPLIAACFIAQDDLALAIMGSTHCPPLDEVDGGNRMTALHWAVEHGRQATAMELLRRGANPLLIDSHGMNVFHRAATFSPSFLVQILAGIESGDLPKPAGRDSKDVLSIATDDGGQTPFIICVLEGSAEHLEAAETLRKQYAVDHRLCIGLKMGNREQTTLLGYLVQCAVSMNLFTLQQVEYVLNLDPRPEFVVDSSGCTLLHYAVSTWQHGEVSSNPVGFAVLRLLLRTFPQRKYLDMTNNTGYNVLHLAVLHSNIHAIEIIHDHLVTTNQPFDLNITTNGSKTPLDIFGFIRSTIQYKEEDEPALFAVLNKNTARTYEYMRNHGAYSSREQCGVPVCIFTRDQTELSAEKLHCFLETIRIVHSLEWELIENDIPPSAKETEQASYTVELTWVFDRFKLRATSVLKDNLDVHLSERFKARTRIMKQKTEYPWMKQEYKEEVCGHRVRWRRGGELWTSDRRRLLTRQVLAAWNEMFGEDESVELAW